MIKVTMFIPISLDRDTLKKNADRVHACVNIDIDNNSIDIRILPNIYKVLSNQEHHGTFYIAMVMLVAPICCWQ